MIVGNGRTTDERVYSKNHMVKDPGRAILKLSMFEESLSIH
jgi:hypothetical protein